MKNLLLTLGHNSSAIMVEDDTVLWGYETERLTGLKSDSRFPMPHLLRHRIQADQPDMVYVSHWSPDGNLSSMKSKYWDPSVFEGIPIRTLGVGDRTHHDAHVYGAMAYAGKAFCVRPNTYALVVDGFGIFGEHLSIYKFDASGTPKLERRVHGYGTSLGLWYQYATAFMGMRMHEDEYKLLGYEVHVRDDWADRMDALAMAKAQEWLFDMSKSVYGSRTDPMFDLSALDNVREKIFMHLNEVCGMFGIADPTQHASRAALAYYVQQVLERVIIQIVKIYSPDNILLSGGVFYNVKLNKMIVDAVPGHTCVYPLAGDQGNAIGLYYMDHPEFEFPANLNWGERRLYDPGHVDGMIFTSSEEAAIDLCQEHIERYGYVNLVRGAMEFGPRAMCNTSTLALPNRATVDRINHANDRNTVMPMAPVMTRSMYMDLFPKHDRLWRSASHMIVAMEYNDYAVHDDILGCCHRYTRPYHHFTGRPQVASSSDNVMMSLLDQFGHPLINTSFNYHGHPIAFDTESAIENHRLQNLRDGSFHTVVITNS